MPISSSCSASRISTSAPASRSPSQRSANSNRTKDIRRLIDEIARQDNATRNRLSSHKCPFGLVGIRGLDDKLCQLRVRGRSGAVVIAIFRLLGLVFVETVASQHCSHGDRRRGIGQFCRRQTVDIDDNAGSAMHRLSKLANGIAPDHGPVLLDSFVLVTSSNQKQTIDIEARRCNQ